MRDFIFAETRRFELPVAFTTHAFQASALDRYATSPIPPKVKTKEYIDSTIIHPLCKTQKNL